MRVLMQQVWGGVHRGPIAGCAVGVGEHQATSAKQGSRDKQDRAEQAACIIRNQAK
jgi:hypothetical protein